MISYFTGSKGRRGFPGGPSGKEQACQRRLDRRDSGSIPGSGRSPGGGPDNLLQCSCLKKPMDRGAWRVTAHGVATSQTRLKQLSLHARNGRVSEQNHPKHIPYGLLRVAMIFINILDFNWAFRIFKF